VVILVTEVNRLLKAVGKKNFIDYYYEFQNIDIDKNILAEKLLNENKRGKKINGQLIIISFAQKIFTNNLQEKVLKIIIKSDRLSEDTIKKAKEIMIKEFEKDKK